MELSNSLFQARAILELVHINDILHLKWLCNLMKIRLTNVESQILIDYCTIASIVKFFLYLGRSHLTLCLQYCNNNLMIREVTLSGVKCW